jgi:rhodanese-related sulfurtransferase
MDLSLPSLLQFVGDHPFLFTALAVAVAALVANEALAQLGGEKRLPAGAAVRLINDQDAAIVDVRAPGDFKRGHIINAINIPAAKLKERIKELPKNKERPVIVYCAIGTTAPSVASELKKLGYGTAFALKGGISGWQTDGLPVTSK